MNNRLKVLRAERNWSQAGKYDPSLPLAFKIARLFQQPIEAIFKDEG
jgi:putative transcriptional regulator